MPQSKPPPPTPASEFFRGIREGKYTATLDQRRFTTWYDPKSLRHLLHSFPNPNGVIRYVFHDYTWLNNAFAQQMKTLMQLQIETQGRPVVFIAKEPGVSSSHYIVGVLIQGKQRHLVVINPTGAKTHRQDFYRVMRPLQKSSNKKYMVICFFIFCQFFVFLI